MKQLFLRRADEMLSILTYKMRRVLKDSKANVAVVTALCALPLFGMMGVAIDYALLLSNKAKLDAAADAAAVAAITAAQTAIQGGSTTTTAQTVGNAQGAKTFMGNAGSIAFGVSGTPTPSVVVSRLGISLSATVKYSTQMTTNFGKLFGIPIFNIQGQSASTLSIPTYKNYYILLDVSNSMGIGATQADMSNLFTRTQAYGNGGEGEAGCVFGCHVASPGRPYSNEQIAHMSPKITMRIDAAISAIQSMISSAQTSSNSSRIQIGLYTMDEIHNSDGSIQQNEYQTIMGLSNNWSALSSAANNIDLGPNIGSVGYGDSNFSSSINQFTSAIPTSGDGSTSTSPLNYVFIITDGLQDTYSGSCTYTHCDSALNSAICQPLQLKAQVGVIYTTYLPIYQGNNAANGYDSTYSLLAASYVPNIPAQLQTCASTPTSSYYFEATTGTDITTGIQKLFAGTDTPARVTQ